MCHASWPMASTSWVWLLRAITVGSLSTMPRPLAYTRVFAVPRSMARSLARPALLARGASRRPAVRAAVEAGGGGQRPELAREPPPVRPPPLGLPGPEPEHQRARPPPHDGDPPVDEG